MKLSEAVNRVIELGQKIRDYYDTQLPKHYKNYPLVGPDEEGPPPPAEETELNDFLANLPGDLIYQLFLIKRLGRWELGAEDLASGYESLPESVGSPAQAAQQMVWEKATLADEISDGLEELRKRKINLDNLPLKRARVRQRLRWTPFFGQKPGEFKLHFSQSSNRFFRLALVCGPRVRYLPLAG